jgi:hypothetical protein
MKQFSTGVEGRSKIARRFNAGNRHSERHPVPEGRLNPRRQSHPSSQTRIISNGKRTNHLEREGHEFTRAVKSRKSTRFSA